MELLGYVIAAGITGVTLLIWRREAGIKLLLQEAATRYKAQAEKIKSLEQNLAEASQRILQLDELTGDLKLVADHAKNQLRVSEKEFAASEEKLLGTNRSLELRLEDQKEQVAAMASQLAAADKERSAAVKAHSEVSAEAAALRKEIVQLREVVKNKENRRMEQSNRQVAALRSENEKLRAALASASPEEVQKWRKKAAQSDRLYQSMKGLRDMADERARNWEVALKKLAKYILAGDPGSPPSEASVGKWVGHALERIGAGIVDDEFTSSTKIPRSSDDVRSGS